MSNLSTNVLFKVAAAYGITVNRLLRGIRRKQEAAAATAANAAEQAEATCLRRIALGEAGTMRLPYHTRAHACGGGQPCASKDDVFCVRNGRPCGSPPA